MVRMVRIEMQLDEHVLLHVPSDSWDVTKCINAAGVLVQWENSTSIKNIHKSY
jgi:hypothetical protein